MLVFARAIASANALEDGDGDIESAIPVEAVPIELAEWSLTASNRRARM